MTPASTDRATRYRGEGRPKRRLSPSPPPPKTPAPKSSPPKKSASKAKEAAAASNKAAPAKKKPRTPTPEEESEDEVLPSSFKSGQPFPTVRDRQPKDLPLRTFKSIAESGVLSAALEKSRQRWLSDGILEKYWVKYSRKNKDEPAPSSQSMTKLNGDCYLVIEPHSFKITLFTVKAPAPTWSTAGPTGLGQPSPRETSTPTSTPGPATPSVPSPFGFHMHSWAPISLPTHTTGATQAESKPTPTALSPAPQQLDSEPSRSAEATPAAEASQSQSTRASDAVANVATSSNQPARPDTSNNTDPVIQMLAARAATDDELKNLMKTVAQGQATQDQLSIFQRHIDELNVVIQAQKRKPLQAGSGTTNPKPFPTQHISTTPTATASTSTFTTVPTAPTQFSYSFSASGQQRPTIKQEPFSTYYHPTPPPSAKPKVPVSSKQAINAIVFEFNEASGTRYLLPRNSILEYLPGNTQVLMSFLIVRKGEEAVAGKYREQKEYYQPVTFRFVADSPKLLEPLARVVAPPDEVRRHMIETMNKLEPAQDVFLATRLPRPEEETGSAEESKAPVSSDEPSNCYDAPNSLLPLAVE